MVYVLFMKMLGGFCYKGLNIVVGFKDEKIVCLFENIDIIVNV